MLATRANARLCSARQIGQIAKSVAVSPAPLLLASRPLLGTPHDFPSSQTRNFGLFSIVKDKVPKKDLASVRITKPIFPGPVYTDNELLGVEVGHREPETLADSLAWKLVRGARKMVDFTTGVTDKKPLTTAQYVRIVLTHDVHDNQSKKTNSRFSPNRILVFFSSKA